MQELSPGAVGEFTAETAVDAEACLVEFGVDNAGVRPSAVYPRL
jgi:hypothetical protein